MICKYLSIIKYRDYAKKPVYNKHTLGGSKCQRTKFNGVLKSSVLFIINNLSVKLTLQTKLYTLTNGECKRSGCFLFFNIVDIQI